jgi:hypothetical protein
MIGETAVAIPRMIGRGPTAIALMIGERERQLVSIWMIGRRRTWTRIAFPDDRQIVPSRIVRPKERRIVRIGAIPGKRPDQRRGD